MDFLKPKALFSKQGKATTYIHPVLDLTPKRRPRLKHSEPFLVSNINDVLEELEKLKDEDEKSSTYTRPTTSFSSVSREKYNFAFRNKTESPKVGSYTPKYNLIKSREDQGPKFMKKIVKPRKRKIFLPGCISNDMSCSFPSVKSTNDPNGELKNFDINLGRTISLFDDFQEQVLQKSSRNNSPIPEKYTKIKTPVKFKVQIERKPFISSSTSPNQRKIDFSDIDIPKKHIKTVNFKKMIPRQELHEPKILLGPYLKFDEWSNKKLLKTLANFGKATGRKEILFETVPKTPESPNLEKFDKAFLQQSTVRGLRQIPPMRTVTARDDAMYRVNEGYIMNVQLLKDIEKLNVESPANIKGSIDNSNIE
ncbi:unnamed protein product [Blepharisma stoltei]|uniref:Uncharacterized protein n=1 Tax=Blepharisma stoltei TaxID=1481888 RepID=A0AAU9IVT0_9CILI|nr:unnamed protein product [Blepharisma stoltei]